MDRREHEALRRHRITGTDIKTIMRGGAAGWNTLSRQLREGKKFYDVGPNTPPQLAWGHQKEEQAVEQFWMRHPEYAIHDPKFLHYDDTDPVMHQHTGCSPDRTLMRYGDGVANPLPLEIKCPHDPMVHRSYLDAGVLPPIYEPQMRWAIHCMDSSYGYFVSCDPRIQDSEDCYFEVRVERDTDYETQMLDRLTKFLEGYLAGEEFTTKLLKTKSADTLREMF